MPERINDGMQLPNRVDPFGNLFSTSHRGTMYGNRGVLHDADRTIRRRAQVRRWLVCVLDFRGRRRSIMQPGRFTELFFLDEAVALAAGHRPCAECRYRDYTLFRDLWTRTHGLDERPYAEEIDDVLHRERALHGGRRQTFRRPAHDLPDGAFVLLDGAPWAIKGDRLLRWTPAGYVEPRPRPDRRLSVITPRSTLAVIRSGYEPGLHHSSTVRS